MREDERNQGNVTMKGSEIGISCYRTGIKLVVYKRTLFSCKILFSSCINSPIESGRGLTCRGRGSGRGSCGRFDIFLVCASPQCGGRSLL